MLYIILLISLVVFFTFGSIAGVRQTKQKLKTDIGERERVEHYAAITFSMWIPVVAVLLVVAFSDIAFSDIGFSPVSFDYNIVFTAVVLALAFLWTETAKNTTASGYSPME